MIGALLANLMVLPSLLVVFGDRKLTGEKVMKRMTNA
jgi:hypothetical protein